MAAGKAKGAARKSKAAARKAQVVAVLKKRRAARKNAVTLAVARGPVSPAAREIIKSTTATLSLAPSASGSAFMTGAEGLGAGDAA